MEFILEVNFAKGLNLRGKAFKKIHLFQITEMGVLKELLSNTTTSFCFTLLINFAPIAEGEGLRKMIKIPFSLADRQKA